MFSQQRAIIVFVRGALKKDCITHIHLICHSTVRLKHLYIDVRARSCIEESTAVWGKKRIL